MKLLVKLIKKNGKANNVTLNLTNDTIDGFLDFVNNFEGKIFVYSEETDIELLKYPLILDKEYLLELINIVDNGKPVSEKIKKFFKTSNFDQLIFLNRYLDIREINELNKKLCAKVGALQYNYHFKLSKNGEYGLEDFSDPKEEDQIFYVPEYADMNIIYQIIKNVEKVVFHLENFKNETVIWFV